MGGEQKSTVSLSSSPFDKRSLSRKSMLVQIQLVGSPSSFLYVTRSLRCLEAV